MSKRRDSPALFELVNSSPSGREQGRRFPTIKINLFKRSEEGQARREARRQERAERKAAKQIAQQQSKASGGEPETNDLAGSLEALGRTVRIPIGFLILALAGAIVLMVVAYSVGYSRGRVAPPENNSRFESGVVDPNDFKSFGNNARSNLDGSGDVERTQPPVGGDETTSRNMDRVSELPSGRIPRTQDTRLVGLNYIVVEQFSPGESERVAEFLEGQGIDVMILPANNRKLRMVVVREGFEGWISNTDAQSMLGRIRRLGQQWKSGGGSKDFSGAFGDKYEG